MKEKILKEIIETRKLFNEHKIQKDYTENNAWYYFGVFDCLFGLYEDLNGLKLSAEINESLTGFLDRNLLRIDEITNNVEFEYKGYFCSEAEEFFKDNVIYEERDGCAVVGTFIKLSNGKTYLPSKGDMFRKNNGDIYKI